MRALRPWAQAPGVALALAALLGPLGAEAQVYLTARPLVGYGQRPDAVTPLVAHIGSVQPLVDDLTARVTVSWPHGELEVRQTVRGVPGAARVEVLPVPLGLYDYARVTLGDTSASLPPTRTAREEGPLTHVAVVGLGQRIAARLCSAAEGLECGALESSELSGDPLIPAAPFAWGGTQVALVDAEALATLPPIAREAFDAWVQQGGVVVVALRTPSQRHRLGPWAHGPGTSLGFGEAWARGLGAVVTVDLDLSTADWDDTPEAAQRFAAMAQGLPHVGAALAPPGTLALHRRVSDRTGPMREVWRSPFNTRGPLGPMAVVLALYVIAVGVVLTRNRRAQHPLRVFVRLPAAAFLVLAATFATTWLSRSRRSEARVVALYDLAAGTSEGTERVFASVTAGGARALTVRPPAGHFSLLHTSAASTGGWLRWDGSRLSVEGARMGLWETASLYTEGPSPLSGAVTLSRDPAGRPVVHNGSGLSLRRGGVLDRDGVTVWPIGPVPPGASVAADEAEVHVGGDNSRRLFGSAVDASAPAMRLLDEGLGGIGGRPGPVQYFATAGIPTQLAGRIGALGLALAREVALVRVIDTSLDPERPALPRGRLDHSPRSPSPRQPPTEPEPILVRQNARDAGAEVDAHVLLQILLGDAGVQDAAP